MPRRNKQSLANDFKLIAKILRDDAVIAKNSHYTSRWGWTPPEREDEYRQLRRLARVADAMSNQLA